MIKIFNKPSKIILDCFTYRNDVHNLHPVSKAIDFIPDWWKELPNFDETELAPKNTMKKCRGFIDLYINSIAIPMWSDLVINYDDKGVQYQYADMLSEIANHDYSQRRGFLPNNPNLKLISPWLFQTKEEINFMTFKPMYNYHESIDFDVCIGIVNFKYQSITNINIVLPQTDKAKKFTINAGQPIWQLVPQTEKKVEIKTHLVSRDEFIKIKEKTGKVKFVDSYGYTKKILQQKQSKCPFGFGK